MTSSIFKILLPSEWKDFQNSKVFKGSPMDQTDGYIHSATAEQWAIVREKFFKDKECVLLELSIDKIPPHTLRFEANKAGGNVYPHIYGTIPLDAVIDVVQIGAESLALELSRRVNLERLYQNNTPFTVKATSFECLALAKRFDLEALDSLEVVFNVKWMQGSAIDYWVDGHLKAALTQSCVVTLKPVNETIDETFHFRVLHPSKEAIADEEYGEFEDIEFSTTPYIDLGDIAAQYLLLLLNPYPRSDEAPEAKEENEPSAAVKKSPFAALLDLKK
jgi:uncharacterized protein (DUF952 family)/uncharacterized metal-binding protein YceD (DUF177 family)